MSGRPEAEPVVGSVVFGPLTRTEATDLMARTRDFGTKRLFLPLVPLEPNDDKRKVCDECKAKRDEYPRIGRACPECGARCGCDWHAARRASQGLAERPLSSI